MTPIILALSLAFFSSVSIGDEPTPSPGTPAVGTPDPSAVYCDELGYASSGGDCVFPDGTRCPTWHFYRGKCGQGWSYCAKRGGRMENRVEDMGTWTASYGVCVFEVVTECGEQDLLDGACGPGDCAKWTSAGGCERTGAAATPTHCGPGELKVLNCTLDTTREIVLSVCASEPLGDGYLQYRFGPPGQVEMAYPEQRTGSFQAFEYSRYTRPRTTYLRLEFEVRGHVYSVIEDDTDEGSFEGVNVGLPDGGATKYRCQGPAEGSLMKLEGSVPGKD